MNTTATQEYARGLAAAWPSMKMHLDWAANAERVRARHAEANARRAMAHLIDETSRNPPTRASFIARAEWHEAQAAIEPRHNPYGDWDMDAKQRVRVEHRAEAARLRAMVAA
jgi:hypothetical protein